MTTVAAGAVFSVFGADTVGSGAFDGAGVEAAVLAGGFVAGGGASVRAAAEPWLVALARGCVLNRYENALLIFEAAYAAAACAFCAAAASALPAAVALFLALCATGSATANTTACVLYARVVGGGVKQPSGDDEAPVFRFPSALVMSDTIFSGSMAR